MPNMFQEGSPDAYFVARFLFDWAARGYTAVKLRVWQTGQTLATEYAMSAVVGLPLQAQISSTTAFVNGDGRYKAQPVFYTGPTISLCMEVVDVIVRNNLPF